MVFFLSVFTYSRISRIVLWPEILTVFCLQTSSYAGQISGCWDFTKHCQELSKVFWVQHDLVIDIGQKVSSALTGRPCFRAGSSEDFRRDNSFAKSFCARDAGSSMHKVSSSMLFRNRFAAARSSSLSSCSASPLYFFAEKTKQNKTVKVTTP